MTILESLTFWPALIFYALALSLGVWGWLLRGPFLQSLARKFLFVGAAFHCTAFIVRFAATGHLPTVGSFENILTGTLVIILVTIIVFRSPRRFPALLGTLPFVILLMGFALVTDTSPRPFIAALRSFWLYIHVIFAWGAYAAFTAAAGTALAYLLTRDGARREDLDEKIFRLTAIGLILDAVMIAAGSIWAKSLWGSYWSWDPVETWSLISFLLYGLILHLRVTLRWRGKVIAWLVLVALITVLISFWGVNLIMEGSIHAFTLD